MIDFFENGLCTYYNLAIRDLSRIENYFDSIERFLVGTTIDIEKNYNSRLILLEGDEQHDLGQVYYDDLIENTIIPSIIHNQSIVVTLSSFVEHGLFQLCIKLSDITGNKFKLVKRKSKVLQCMDYLREILNIERCSNLVKYYQVRNEIVHNSGVSSHCFSKVAMGFPREQIKSIAGSRIEVSSAFISEYLKVIRDYFEKLGGAIQNFIKLYHQKNA
ncbi:hypothetical protein WMQ48_20560 [Vibrio cidicii]|uniref:hypothetical protein n=1 Tax=Vibrio TaxID=662 RepID=UPI0018DD41FA|nr:hypothetical protein [Vibrio navarrensis]MBH9739342.1 hypothetical protein [Vibrio navarrensis]